MRKLKILTDKLISVILNEKLSSKNLIILEVEMKKFVMQLLAFALTLAMLMPVMAKSDNGPQLGVEEPAPLGSAAEPAEPTYLEFTRYIDGEDFWNLNLAVYGLGELFIIDEEIGYVNVVLTDRQGVTISFFVDETLGFIEYGVVWVSPDFVFERFEALMFGHFVTPRVERIDLTVWNEENFADVRDISHTTDMPHGEIATYYIRFMSENLPSRSPFSYPELDAAIWLVEELLAMGHDFNNIEVQEFTYWDLLEYYDISIWWGSVTWPSMIGEGREELLREDRVSQNVVLTLPGQSDRKIIVGAHYDSLVYPGASDNASGTALLLESAFRMLELDHYYTIVYVFFGAEEVGLIGAHYFYAQLSDTQRDNIVMMVNADVLIEGPYLIYGAGGMPVIEDEEAMQIIRERLIEEVVEMFNRWHDEWHEQLEEMHDDFLIELIEGEYEVYGSGYVIFEDDFEIFIFDDFVREDVTAEDLYWILDLSDEEIMSWAFGFGIVDIGMDEYAQMVSSISAELNLLYEFELITIPEAIGLSSDQLVFLNAGHTVVMLAGLERIENVEHPGFLTFRDEFTLTILHSPQDEFYYIEARWPGMIQNNMRGFGLLLERILTLGQ